MTTEHNQTIDNLSIATIRTLAIDAIEKAKSGHPGMPMGCCRQATVPCCCTACFT